MTLKFLNSEEMEALKFAIGESEGLTIGECTVPSLINRHFLVPETDFMMYDTGERCICLAWVLGNETSFVEIFVHEEIHRVLHKHIDLESCCAYDNISKYVEGEMLEVLVYAR